MQYFIDGFGILAFCKCCDFVRVTTGFQVGYLLLIAFVVYVFGGAFHFVRSAWFVLLEGMACIVTGGLFCLKFLLGFFQVCNHGFLERFETRLVRTG